MPNQFEPSRLRKRTEKKQDRFLNWAIGIVSVLILVVGAFLFFIIKDSPSDQAAGSYIESHDNTSSNDSSTSDTKDQTETNTNNDQTDTASTDTSDGDKSNETTTTDTKGDSDVVTDVEGGGPAGPWEPIGTSQEEPHQKSYSKGSQDWKEMERTLAYAVGTDVDQMTTWWLGNGGAEDLSLGQVSKKGDDKVYEVVLQWVTDEGWKPTSVKEISKNEVKRH